MTPAQRKRQERFDVISISVFMIVLIGSLVGMTIGRL
jgi:hypothetical protein